MGFSNLMSMVGGSSGAPPSNANPDVAAAHGDPAGGASGGGAEHRDMNFGDKLLNMAESKVPGASTFFPQAQAQAQQVPGQSMPEQPDLLAMNAKPPSGGGLSTLLKLIGV